jgi:ATP-dependent helicase/nuclease subunit A
MPERTLTAPPDQDQRELALDPTCSAMVQAPAGSGKTDLLTRRFLRLLGEVNDPSEIVAITFTRAAAAEMRNRILAELEMAAAEPAANSGEFSMEALAARALERSRRLDWKLLELSSQLRISTIDSFCAEIAARQPLLSRLGSGLRISESPDEIYRRAARATLMQLGADTRAANPDLTDAIERLLEWRDNNWSEIESHLVAMLAQRDRWMQDFVLDRDPDWESLRERLERPFARAVSAGIEHLVRILRTVPGACAEAHELARFACAQSGNARNRELAELADLPLGPFANHEEMEELRHVFLCLADLFLTGDNKLRRRFDVSVGFPPDRKREKQRILVLTQMLADVPGLESALASIRDLPPARYTDDEWSIVRAAFTLLHHAAGHLQVAFAEAGVADFVEVAQAARRVLQDEHRQPTEAAWQISDGIRHLLVDEFQDTSRRQHQLLSALVSEWPDPTGRTLFVVGDPMQSIYFFRQADPELFARVQSIGLELADGERHLLRGVRLTANFRTAPELVAALNGTFGASFANDDGSGIHFDSVEPARLQASSNGVPLELHIDFAAELPRSRRDDPDSEQDRQDVAEERKQSTAEQLDEMVSLIQLHHARAIEARERGGRYRIAVLGRTRASLTPIAQALRQASVPFRAVELEPLAMRPEILDALALVRALYFAQDRAAWLGVLRAPWCGLSLQDLNTLCGAEARRPVPELLRERLHLLSSDGRAAAARLIQALDALPSLRSALPLSSLGTSIEQVWVSLGGPACVDAQARGNLDLLWQCLDRLPSGEPDLLGRQLHAALQKLSAQPDPNANGDCGVQLMTIHKSKGLEFEVVIVPDLHAGSRKTTNTMLSWLERGLAEADDTNEITEFLIAPFQPKGVERSAAKKWVDDERRKRERQEMRRIFYVAATRAREELHLFTRAEYKGDGELCKPPESLLEVAWPAFEPEIRRRFAEWRSHRQEAEIEKIAAGGNNLVEMPGSARPASIRRLPPGYQPTLRVPAPARFSGNRASPLFLRHLGGMESRALGTAVHTFLEEAAHRRASSSWEDTRAALPVLLPRLVSHARASGMDHHSAEQIVGRAVDIALSATREPAGAWILSPHPDAASESRWTGVVNGAIHTVQVDRVFRAGPAPQSEGENVWWIIDYKSAHSDVRDLAEALPHLRELFAPQLEIYAEVLRGLHGREIEIRAGLYYPRLPAFDWWEL